MVIIMYEEFKAHCIAAYGGYIKDDKELLSCTSGGIATALSIKFIEDGGYVAGVKYTLDFKSAEYYISNKIAMSGSVNTSKAGKYTITYTVTNSSGSKATVKRTITVKGKESSNNKDKDKESKENKTEDKPAENKDTDKKEEKKSEEKSEQ